MASVEKQIQVACDFQLDKTVNYAIQQNHVPIVKRLCIGNVSFEALAQMTVSVVALPDFASQWETTISGLQVGQTLDLGPVDMQLSPAFLAGLTERLAGMLVVAVKAGDDVLFNEQYPIDVLAYDEWNGMQTLPELIAAFITPNHPQVSDVLQQASSLMDKWSADPSLNGYQSKDPNRVRLQLAAIYTALQQREVAYCVPPASFEEHGQKIRTPDAIMEHRLGTCLDLAVLYAACAEAAGLNPLVVFTEGHAFPGAWLVEHSFSDSVQDDVTLLTKRIATGVQEVCVLETTALTAGRNCPFEEAVSLGEMNLRNPDQFLFFVDVHRARASHIRPLPLRVGGRPVADAGNVSFGDSAVDTARPQLDIVKQVAVPESVAKLEHTRLEQWERRLLDLSLRNPLLNFRVTAGSILLLCPALSDLEDALAEGQDFQMAPRPLDWEATPRDETVYRRRNNSDPQVRLLREELAQHRLRADLPDKDLSMRLTRLYRAARTSLEENGANTLYLALGMLVWYESEASQKPRHAPILLIPMELVRKSVQAGYVLREGEDEPQLNVTLIEMLRQDFGIDVPGLDGLPQDEHGTNVGGVLTRVRRAVMHKARWDVLDEGYLGLFSFSKFVMWHDLRTRTADLKQNKLVASLMAGSLQWIPNADPVAQDFDTAYHPKDLFCPVSADSSQLKAICEAGKGTSLVLHGPPGTGKSQTITNIIAHALANGRTVLFVAEKMAALTVVQRRLAGIGLGPFCLEVHSNKSKKKDVLAQLQRALEVPDVNESENWQAEADRLAHSRQGLNDYVLALHRKRNVGLSVFEMLSRLAAVQNAPNVVAFGASDVAGLTSGRLREWTDLAHQLRVAGESCVHPHDSVWVGSRREEYTPRLRDQCAGYLSRLGGLLATWREASPPVFDVFGFGGPDASYRDLAVLLRLAVKFLSVPGIPGILIGTAEWEETRSTVETWISHGRTRDDLRSQVFSGYTERVLQLDVPALRESLRTADLAWFLPRMIGRNRVAKAMRKTMKPGIALDNAKLDAELTRLQRLRDEERILASAGDRARQVLGRLWQDGNADWSAVAGVSQWANEVRGLAGEAAGSDLDRLKSLRDRCAQIVSDWGDQLKDGPVARQLRDFAEAGKAVMDSCQALSSLLEMDPVVLKGNEIAPEWFDRVTDQVRRWEESVDSLRVWCAWQRVRNRAVVGGLAPLVTPYEEGRVANGAVEPAFERGVYQALAEHEVEGEPILSSFSRALFEDAIRQFRELDDAYEKLTRQVVFARLASRIPRMNGDVSQNSEMGILRRELLRQRNHMALRRLFQRIPNVLSRLKPCLLMSPISVAQYLDPAHPPFDIVVFDEASQVPTCDAVGAVARGRQAVIVGDPKQLPPTSFFMTGAPEYEDEGLAVEDLESILDDCVALHMPEERLLWHYRSRHESLIAFSNWQYYANGLLTFPSPDDLTSAVQLRPVAGYYDRSKSKQNRAEADAVVAEVVRRLRDPQASKQSVGVVTFSQPQQQLIEDLLDEKRLQYPELEQFFSTDIPEPVFIKNLENVQGDERDVILFSIGYGPDSSGRVTMNFGPLNWPGGWRRLNVAVSRARREMLAYSTLRPEDIDLSRTSAQGVRDLKAFLEYARRGRKALTTQISVSSDAEPESMFEEQVCQALRRRGHDVHLQVGCSGYRIDLAIVDPRNPGRYLLGIECDGAKYHRAKTARDRDKLREMVLRELGWNLLRIWSTDWWENPDAEVKRVEDAITVAKAGSEIRRPDLRKTDKADPPAVAPVRRIASASTAFGSTAAPGSAAPLESAADRSKTRCAYVVCQLPPMGLAPDEFYLADSTTAIENQIAQVVNVEGPISLGLLCRRVVAAWGMSRVGGRIETQVRAACRRLRLRSTRVGSVVFYWPQGTDPDEYAVCRVPGGNRDSRRGPEDLPPEEMAAGALEVLQTQVGLPEEDLVREVARLFGYQRMGSTVEQYLQRGIDLVKQRGNAHWDSEGHITLSDR